jgi:hypothetical protein
MENKIDKKRQSQIIPNSKQVPKALKKILLAFSLLALTIAPAILTDNKSEAKGGSGGGGHGSSGHGSSGGSHGTSNGHSNGGSHVNGVSGSHPGSTHINGHESNTHPITSSHATNKTSIPSFLYIPRGGSTSVKSQTESNKEINKEQYPVAWLIKENDTIKKQVITYVNFLKEEGILEQKILDLNNKQAQNQNPKSALEVANKTLDKKNLEESSLKLIESKNKNLELSKNLVLELKKQIDNQNYFAQEVKKEIDDFKKESKTPQEQVDLDLKDANLVIANQNLTLINNLISQLESSDNQKLFLPLDITNPKYSEIPENDNLIELRDFLIISTGGVIAIVVMSALLIKLSKY